MNRNMRLALVLGTLALLFWADTAQAQRRIFAGRWGRNRGYYNDGYGYYNSNYYGGYGYYTGNYYPQPNTYGAVDASTPVTSQSLYRDPASLTGTARLRVICPTPETRLVIDGAPTTMMGMNRLFETPTLEPGRTYTHTIQATWMQNGQEVTRQQEVQVRPGQEMVVGFRFEGGQVLPNPVRARRG